MDAGVQLKADEDDDGIEVYPKHDDDERADGAVELVILPEVIDEIGKAQRDDYGQHGSERGAG